MPEHALGRDAHQLIDCIGPVVIAVRLRESPSVRQSQVKHLRKKGTECRSIADRHCRAWDNAMPHGRCAGAVNQSITATFEARQKRLRRECSQSLMVEGLMSDFKCRPQSIEVQLCGISGAANHLGLDQNGTTGLGAVPGNIVVNEQEICQFASAGAANMIREANPGGLMAIHAGNR